MIIEVDGSEARMALGVLAVENAGGFGSGAQTQAKQAPEGVDRAMVLRHQDDIESYVRFFAGAPRTC